MCNRFIFFACAAIVLTLLFCVSAGGNEGFRYSNVIDQNNSVGLIDRVHLIVNNEVKDGCLENTKQIYDKLRYRLELIGISVDEENVYGDQVNPRLEVNIIGKKVNYNLCVSSFNMNIGFHRILFFVESKDYLSNDLRLYCEMWSQDGMLVVPGRLDEPLLRTYDSVMDDLIADILSARKDKTVIQGKKDYNMLFDVLK